MKKVITILLVLVASLVFFASIASAAPAVSTENAITPRPIHPPVCKANTTEKVFTVECYDKGGDIVKAEVLSMGLPFPYTVKFDGGYARIEVPYGSLTSPFTWRVTDSAGSVAQGSVRP